MRYVIIGNSAAGTFAAEALRALDPEAKITMISREEGPPYSRCLLPYYLEGAISEEGLYIRPPGFYEVLGIEAYLGREAVQIHPGLKKVFLDDGREIIYDRLLLATGAEPRLPPIPGRELFGVFTFRHLEDARKLRQQALKSRRAVVVGGGLVGVEVAAALRGLGLEVTLVEFLPHLLPQALDERGSSLVQKALASHGIEVILERQVAAILGEDEVKAALLNDGRLIPCDLVVVAVGVRAAIDLLSPWGAEVNLGLVVNDFLQTSLPGIYAAGDVVEHYDLAQGKRGVTAVWPAAATQGRVAGCNMAGRKARLAGYINVNTAEICGLRIAAAGLPKALSKEDHEYYYLDRASCQYRKIVTRQGRLVGMILIGRIEGAGILANFILKGEIIEGYEREILHGNFWAKGRRWWYAGLQPGQVLAANPYLAEGKEYTYAL
ncbi:Pyridine nucleotide-disulphide oxidoreductase [Thermanaeromonas toyohensis ToBE]|uniref:Pyridine nucleotide-disulphide oxidoreductase n=1 Tax=Thermanaeromonas toyohensis ToBE TaxID=698762 RepID=A0A1W1VGP1_9FIRM|nr:FAD-dependent oxidoreductase [Thermanaeromonas toyohensis]SMB92466.1 Pyridine nucleotide-disulphide oxidoreductase [Thermanaeromonas toyohensis ToBE]